MENSQSLQNNTVTAHSNCKFPIFCKKSLSLLYSIHALYKNSQWFF